MMNSSPQNLKKSTWIARYTHHFLMVFCVLILSACGGGGGGSVPAAVDATLFTTPIQSPASTTSGIRQSGVLNFDMAVQPYARFLVSGTVTFTTPQGVMSLTSGLGTITFTSAGYSTSSGTGFFMPPGLDANAVLHCSSIASTSGRALLSSNLIPVNSLNELKGKSFKANYCEYFNTTLPTVVFNTDGSISVGSESISQSQVSSFFSVNGVGFGTSEATRWRAYKALVDGQYLYTILDEGVDGAGYYIGLLTQN